MRKIYSKPPVTTILSMMLSNIAFHCYCASYQQSKRPIYPISVHKINERKSTESENKNESEDLNVVY